MNPWLVSAGILVIVAAIKGRSEPLVIAGLGGAVAYYFSEFRKQHQPKESSLDIREAFVDSGMNEGLTNEGPSEWPSLVGISGEDAKQAILKEKPDLHVEIIPENSMVTMDYREDRVRIFVKDDNTVARAPMIG